MKTFSFASQWPSSWFLSRTSQAVPHMQDRTQIYFTLIHLGVISFTDVLGSTTNVAESLDIGSILGMAEMQGRWTCDQRDQPTFNALLLTYKTGTRKGNRIRSGRRHRVAAIAAAMRKTLTRRTRLVLASTRMNL